MKLSWILILKSVKRQRVLCFTLLFFQCLILTVSSLTIEETVFGKLKVQNLFVNHGSVAYGRSECLRAAFYYSGWTESSIVRLQVLIRGLCSVQSSEWTMSTMNRPPISFLPFLHELGLAASPACGVALFSFSFFLFLFLVPNVAICPAKEGTLV